MPFIMIGFFFVKNFLTNLPQNCGNMLAPAGGVKLLCRQTASCSGVIEHLSFVISDCRLTLSQSPAATFRALISEIYIQKLKSLYSTTPT